MVARKTEEVTKDVNVTRIVDPRFLTLTKKPANQVAFKIVRSEDGNGSKRKITRERATRRMAPTLAIQFPEGATDDEISNLMKEFGFSDYRLEDVDGHKVALRADTEMPTQYGTILLKDGVKVLLSQGPVIASDENPEPNIAVVEINFNKDEFDTTDSVRGWLTRNDIDFSDELTFNSDNKVVVPRLLIGDGVETRRIAVEDGVELVIARAAEQDVPVVMVEVVSELAYGNWGWGQLDFTAAMADVEYGEISEQALGTLRRVMEELVFWSRLPLTMRKELIARAAQQYSDFMGKLLDSLPAKVVLTESRSQRREQQMVQKTDVQKRADEARAYLAGQKVAEDSIEKEDDAVITQADAKRQELADTQKAVEKDAANITRGEVVTLLKENNAALRTELLPEIGNTVRDSIKALFVPVETTERSDGTSDKSAAVKTEGEELGTHIGNAMRTAMEPFAGALKAMSDSQAATAKAVADMASAATVRSDNGDVKQTESRPDVFAGVFGGRKSSGATQ